MNSSTCTLCNLPIGPGQPAARTTPIDLRDGRIVTLPGRSYHTGGACRDAWRANGYQTVTATIVA